LSLDLQKRKWVIEFDHKNMHVKGILKEDKAEEDVKNEIERYITINPDASLIDYYYGAYDSKKNDYIKVSSKYAVDCGKSFEVDSKAKTRRVIIQRELLKGEPSDSSEIFSMSDECKNCNTKKRKTKGEYLNPIGGLFITEETYCTAKRIENKNCAK